MDAAPPSTPPTTTSVTPPSPMRLAWPRSARWTPAFLLGLATALLASHALGQLRWGSRPTELTYRVDLNRAQRAELLQLPGVGDALAERIEEYRHEKGGF